MYCDRYLSKSLISVYNVLVAYKSLLEVFMIFWYLNESPISVYEVIKTFSFHCIVIILASQLEGLPKIVYLMQQSW